MLEIIGIIGYPLGFVVIITFLLMYVNDFSPLQWYRENCTELGRNIKRKKQQMRSVGKEWRELKEHQEMLSRDPIALEHYKRKADERLKSHKEYDKMLWEAEAPEREARHKENVEREERERQERIRLYREESDLRRAQNLDSLRQKELNYYNVSQTYGGNMLNPTQRLADVNTVLREHPTTKSSSLVAIPTNTIINCTGWLHGEDIGGSDIWFAVKMGTLPNGKDYYQYVWSGACTEKHTGGLHDFNEYEEDTYTVKAADGSICQTYTNKTLIKRYALEPLTETQVAKAITYDRISATMITADKLYV
jgi:hypothetical protein